MDVNKILADLRKEHEQVDEAILNLEDLARSRVRRRVRTPGWFPKRSDDPDEC